MVTNNAGGTTQKDRLLVFGLYNVYNNLKNRTCFGLEEKRKKGFALYMKSAEQGHGLAMKAVGVCYQFGEGVEDNMKEAIKWYEKALEVIDDPELARKVMVFKTLPDLED